VLGVPQFFRIRAEIAKLGMKYRLPIISGQDGFAQLGGLITNGPGLIDNWRQTAVDVDRILKDEKPAGLPISQPTKCELAINLKTAKALGLIVSPKPARARQRGDRMTVRLLRCSDTWLWREAAVLAVGPLVRSWGLSRRAVHTSRMRARDPEVKQTRGNVAIGR
jgi:hypothetical protein